MAGISFGDEPQNVWIVAGWAFRQFLQDIEPWTGGDLELTNALAESEIIGFLDVQSLNDTLRAKMTKIIEGMCRGILDGTCPSGIRASFPDAETHEAYLVGIRELLSAAETTEPG